MEKKGANGVDYVGVETPMHRGELHTIIGDVVEKWEPVLGKSESDRPVKAKIIESKEKKSV